MVLDPDTIIDDESIKIKRPEPLGYIGDTFQRFQIHITTISKSQANPYEYKITGKTKVKNNICRFSGIITITAATWKNPTEDIGFSNYRFGHIISKIIIYEDKNDAGSGIIQGNLTTEVYLDDKNRFQYDALMLVADGFSNSMFIGTWTSYKTGKTKKCNWGDFRIPESADLDVGTGEFSPNSKYSEYGWGEYRTLLISNKEEEKTEWWR